MKQENQFFIWEEKNLIEPRMKFVNSGIKGQNDIIKDTKKSVIENEWKDIGKIRRKKSFKNDIKPEDKFGKLTAKYYDKKRFQWFCECDCGGTSFVASNRLIDAVRSCYRCKRITYDKIEINKKYNSLTTIVYDNSKSCWVCKCDCGNVSYVRSSSLAKNKIKSCGCLFRGPRLNKRHPNNYTLKMTLFRSYKENAKRRGKEFNLSENFFIKSIMNNCYYCGMSPMSFNKRFLKYDKNFKYNGIDRVDNSKGYIEENCVTCCEICNRAKSEMSINEFKNWIKRIYDKQINNSNIQNKSKFTLEAFL